ncbi:F0F1 ATP synthase subunit B [Rhizosphaericola mali]|uniref:ATP synthase subunit b n=1 Tax=Rhizosphaericola mali TaxID=2545455 RepID=A0A5P2G531_9BACT|nr:F0F1 ATP synthase subunit B [Rhizosphaericola mali]QES89798.1 F0F1 ATP synthase subunit B [Rhizosphaericola mali]
MELLNPGLGIVLYSLIAFVIVLLILRAAAWKPILKTLNERESGIADALAAAEKAKSEMASLKSENEALLAKAIEERANLLKDANASKERIISEAQTEGQRVKEQLISEAQQAITAQKNAAIADVKNQVGSIALEIAQKVIGRELADKSQQENYINQLTSEIKLN